MSARVFETFCEMIESVPTKAVIPAAEAERRMVQDDLAKQRVPFTEESLSVLGFCNVLISAARGFAFPLPAWPLEHYAYYRKVIKRLVTAGELPFTVKDRFDLTFFRALKDSLASPA